MHDHLGGGFHRYSVDRFWHSALITRRCYTIRRNWPRLTSMRGRLTVSVSLKRTARDILDYVRRDYDRRWEAGSIPPRMRTSLIPGGNEKGEGAFYVWAKAEIDEVLGPDAALFSRVYGVEADGNSPPGSDPHGELGGLNTLIRRLTDAEAGEILPKDRTGNAGDARAMPGKAA